MIDLAVSYIRTSVPSLWGAVVAWLISTNLLPADMETGATAMATAVLVPVAISAVYMGARWLEHRPWMPRWLVRILLGSSSKPTYHDYDIAR